MVAASSRSRHWRALDSVRGAAVIAVVCWHVYKLTLARGMNAHAVPVYLWPLGTARLGVDVFFVLSGLLVTRSWHGARERAAHWFEAAWDFVRRRARWILPAYWVSLIVLVPLLASSLLDDPRRLLAFVTLNQYVKFWLPDKVNPVTWSLTTEWHFYLLVPLVAWLLRNVGRWRVLAACIALTVVWWMHPPFFLPSSFIFGRLDQFVAGAIVGQLVVESRSTPHALERLVHTDRFVPVAVAGLVALGTYHGASLGLGHYRLADALLHPLFGLLTAGLLLRMLTDTRERELAAGPLLAWFGVISFGLYLWHYPILDQGLRLARAAAPMPDAVAMIIAVPALVACSVLAAHLSYVLVERPFTRPRERPEPPKDAGTLASWPSPRSWESRPSTP